VHALTVLRQLQVPLLALVLLVACAAKLLRLIRADWAGSAPDMGHLFPRRLRLPVAIAQCTAEGVLATGLALTARFDGGATDGFRAAAALFFLVCTSALLEVRKHRPDLGCGCFGTLSAGRVHFRTIVRAGALTGAALATIGAPVFRRPSTDLLDAGLLGCEIVLLAVLSPEVGEILARLGYSEPCEVSLVPPEHALASLHRSRVWRKHMALIADAAPQDMWRELCWWYVVYRARYTAVGSGGAVAFAVQVKRRWPAIRAAVVEPSTGHGLQEAALGASGQSHAASVSLPSSTDI
jgi:hypothetical protein